MSLTYLGPPCLVPGCTEPATQRVRYRSAEPPFGRHEEAEMCEQHARGALTAERRPCRVTPLAAWTKHLAALARKAEEDELRLTMAAQQRWDI